MRNLILLFPICITINTTEYKNDDLFDYENSGYGEINTTAERLKIEDHYSK